MLSLQEILWDTAEQKTFYFHRTKPILRQIRELKLVHLNTEHTNKPILDIYGSRVKYTLKRRAQKEEQHHGYTDEHGAKKV